MRRGQPTTALSGLPRGILPLVAVDLRRVSVLEGVRAALATAVIVALNEWLRWPPLSIAALAALLTCLCDPGGPVRRRLPPILTFGLLGALVSVGFGVLRNAPLPLVVPLAAAGVFCTLFARAFGQAGQQIGNLLTVVLVLALTRHISTAHDAAAIGLAFWGGSLWAALLTLVIWRVHPFLPARRAVADAFRALADLAGDLHDVLRHEPTNEARWDAHARQQRRRVRETIERAREALLATVRARGPVSSRAAQTWLRLEAAEQIFGALIGLSEQLASSRRCDAAAERLLRLLRPLLLLLAHGIERDFIARLPRLERAAAAIAATGDNAPELRATAEALADRLRLAAVLATPEGWQPGTPPETALREVWRGAGGRLRASLDWQSEVLRHALRGAAAALLAFTVTLGWPTSYGHWLTIMLVMTMQPYVAVTFARALERIAGTLLGGVIAAALAAVCTTSISIALALFPLAIIAFAVRPASFGLFITCLTPLIVLLSELGRPGESELTIAAMRALYVVIGSGLAVGAVLLLWPSWEPGRLGREMAAAIVAHGRFAAAEIAVLLGDAGEEAAGRARRAAGIASNNLEASLHRMLIEPRAQDARLTAALTIDAALRRIAGRISTLHLDPGPRRDLAAWRAWAAWSEAASSNLAAGAKVPPRPALPAGDALCESLLRIARQIDVTAGALQRLSP